MVMGYVSLSISCSYCPAEFSLMLLTCSFLFVDMSVFLPPTNCLDSSLTLPTCIFFFTGKPKNHGWCRDWTNPMKNDSWAPIPQKTQWLRWIMRQSFRLNHLLIVFSLLRRCYPAYVLLFTDKPKNHGWCRDWTSPMKNDSWTPIRQKTQWLWIMRQSFHLILPIVLSLLQMCCWLACFLFTDKRKIHLLPLSRDSISLNVAILHSPLHWQTQKPWLVQLTFLIEDE